MLARISRYANIEALIQLESGPFFAQKKLFYGEAADYSASRCYHIEEDPLESQPRSIVAGDITPRSILFGSILAVMLCAIALEGGRHAITLTTIAVGYILAEGIGGVLKPGLIQLRWIAG